MNPSVSNLHLRFCIFQNQHEQTKHSVYSNAYDLIKHNLVVFRSGEGALQILPKLLDVIPEARLNLIIYYLQQVPEHASLSFILPLLVHASAMLENYNLIDKLFIRMMLQMHPI